MKKLQNHLKSVSKSLSALSKQVEKLSQQVGRAQPANKVASTRQKSTLKTYSAAPGGKTVLDTVYDAIKRTKKGATIAQLKQRTNLNSRQLSNAIYKLSKRGQVYAKSRGLYMKR
jgi:hypothetical protein